MKIDIPRLNETVVLRYGQRKGSCESEVCDLQDRILPCLRNLFNQEILRLQVSVYDPVSVAEVQPR